MTFDAADMTKGIFEAALSDRPSSVAGVQSPEFQEALK
jgi:hypothetical protein